MRRNFEDFNELKKVLTKILDTRPDLTHCRGKIISGLRKESSEWGWIFLYFTGIILPKYNGTKQYTFQLVSDKSDGCHLTFTIECYIDNIIMVQDWDLLEEIG